MIDTLLLTSTGGTVGALLVEMVRDALPASARIVAADAAVDVSYLGRISRAATLPFTSDPSYGSALNALIDDAGIDTVMPLSEEECLVVSRLAENGDLRARYLGMDHATLSLITDKLRCAAALTEAGLDVPKCLPLQDPADLDSRLAALGYPDRPVVLKPVSARGSRGFRVVDAKTDRLAEFSRKGGPIFMDADQARETFRDSPAETAKFFLMEFLPGGSVSADLVAWHGQALGIFPHVRLGYEWGFVDHARIAPDPDVEAYCRATIEALGMHGLCNIELGYRADGRLSLIEVNGRTSATAAQSRLVGANCFDMLLRAEAGDLTPFTFTEPAEYRTLTEYRRVGR